MSMNSLTNEQVQRLETAVLDFDLGWQPGRWTEFVHGLPADDPTWRQRVVVEATKVDLERNYRAGQRPGLAEYAAVCPELEHDSAVAAELQEAVAELERRSGTLQFSASASETSSAAAETPAPRAAAPVSPTDAESLGRLRDYRLLAELGRGGMGAVYRALHTRLEKVVALKVLPSERLARAEDRERFEREMRAIGQMNHPHLVAAHDAGEADGKHFLVMELVAGADVGKLPAPLAPPEACEIVRQAALGLHYAHQRGLVHRDIKPSNLMLAWREAADGSPEAVVKVLDFGLALLGRESAAGRELTTTGAIMGTLDYLAPEQALDSHHVTPRADLYSLGATLFKLLAGTVPFDDGVPRSLTQRLLDMQSRPAPSLATRRPDLPPVLTQLVDRLLAQSPDARPASAAEVATLLAPWCAGANLTRLLAGHERGASPDDAASSIDATFALADSQPPPRAVATPSSVVTYAALDSSLRAPPETPGPSDVAIVAAAPRAARPAGRVPRRRLWLALAASAVTLLGVILYFTTGEGLVEVTVNEPNARVTYDEGTQQITAEVAGRAVTIRPSPGKHLLLVEKDGHVRETREFHVRRRRKLQLAVELKPLPPPDPIPPTASAPTPAPASASPRATLLTPALAAHLPELADVDRRVATNRSSDPFAATVVKLRQDLVATLYAVRRQLIGPAAPLAERDSLLTDLLDAEPKLKAALPWPADALTRESIRPYELRAAGHGDPTRAPAEVVAILGDSRLQHWAGVSNCWYTPDGESLITWASDLVLRTWNRKTGEQTRALDLSPFEPQYYLTLTPDRTEVIFRDERNRMQFRKVATGEETRPTIAAGMPAVSDNGKVLMIGSDFWSFPETKPLYSGGGSAASAAIAPDGSFAATCDNNGEVTVWNVAERKSQHKFKLREPCHLAFHPDGKRFVTSGHDGTTMWDAGTGKELWKGPSGESSAFDREGKLVAVTHLDSGRVLLLDAETGTEARRVVVRIPQSLACSKFRPDGKELAIVTFHGPIQFLDVSTGDESRPVPGHEYSVRDAAVSPDGSLLATGSADGTIRLWRLAPTTASAEGGAERQMALVRTIEAALGYIYSLAFSPDGRRLASGHGSGANLRLWDVASGDVLRTVVLTDQPGSALTFRSDGRLIAMAGGAGTNATIRLFDAETLEPLAASDKLPSGPTPLVFDPRGSQLAALFSLSDKEVLARLWSVPELKPLSQSLAATSNWQGTMFPGFSPDGRLFGNGLNVKLWDTAKWRERLTLPTFNGTGGVATFSADGRRIYSASGGKVSVWNPYAAVGDDPLEREIPLATPTSRIAKLLPTPDGRHLVTVNANGTMYVLRLSSGPAVGSDRSGPLVAAVGSKGTDVADSPRGVLDGPERRLVAQPPTLPGVERWTVELPDAGGEYVGAVALSPDGRRVAYAVDNSAWFVVRDVDSGRITQLLPRRGPGPLQNLAWSPDGRLAAAEGEALSVWDCSHHAPRDAAAPPDAVPPAHHAERDGYVPGELVFRAFTAPPNSQRMPNCVSWSPNGRWLASASLGWNTVTLWNPTSHRRLPIGWDERAGSAQSVSWPTSGDRLTIGARNAVVIGDAEPFRSRITFLPGKMDESHYAVVSPDGTRVAACVPGKRTIFLWTVAQPDTPKQVETPTDVWQLTWTPNGRLLVAPSNSKLLFFDGQSLEPKDLSSKNLDEPGASFGATAVSFSADGKRMATATNWRIMVRDLPSFAPRLEVPVHCRSVFPSALAPDGERLIVRDGTRGKWQCWRITDAPTLLQEGDGDCDAAWSPDGRLVFVFGSAIELYDAESFEKKPFAIERKPQTIKQVIWSPDNRRIAVLGQDGSVVVWGLTGKTLFATQGRADVALRWSNDSQRLFGGQADKLVHWQFGDEPLHFAWPPECPQNDSSHACWSPDGRRVAFFVKGSEWREILIWDVEKSQSAHRLPAAAASGVDLAFDSSGTLLTACFSWSRDADRTRDYFLRTWHVSSGRVTNVEVPGVPIDGTTRLVPGPALSTRSHGRIRVVGWDGAASPLGTMLFPGPDGQHAVRVTPDGRVSATSPEATAGLVYVLETPTGRRVLTPAEFAGESQASSAPKRSGE